LIVASTGLRGDAWEPDLVTSVLLVVATAFGFWWNYFPFAKPALDRVVENLNEKRLTAVCRDAFSVAHFLMVCSLVLFVGVAEEVLAHPDHALPLAAWVALSAGLVLFVGGMALSL
jgi:low temperature requirement protein LtrA